MIGNIPRPPQVVVARFPPSARLAANAASARATIDTVESASIPAVPPIKVAVEMRSPRQETAVVLRIPGGPPHSALTSTSPID